MMTNIGWRFIFTGLVFFVLTPFAMAVSVDVREPWPKQAAAVFWGLGCVCIFTAIWVWP